MGAFTTRFTASSCSLCFPLIQAYCFHSIRDAKICSPRSEVDHRCWRCYEEFVSLVCLVQCVWIKWYDLWYRNCLAKNPRTSYCCVSRICSRAVKHSDIKCAVASWELKYSKVHLCSCFARSNLLTNTSLLFVFFFFYFLFPKYMLECACLSADNADTKVYWHSRVGSPAGISSQLVPWGSFQATWTWQGLPGRAYPYACTRSPSQPRQEASM